ncbi:MAG: chemotaxis protein CheW, partial [Nitrospirota bacterium]
APDIVTGIVNIHGSIIPVFNIRRRFHLPETAINLTDKLIIARTAGRSVGIVVDAVSDVMEYTEKDIVNADKIVPGMEYIYGVAKLDGNMILIHNIDKFLSPGEENKLDEAVKKL